MNGLKAIIIGFWVGVMLLTAVSFSWSQTRTDVKQDEYIYSVLYGGSTHFYAERIWAWLESIKRGNLDPSTPFQDVIVLCRIARV